MRLLHSRDLQFEEFYEPDVPQYAILSHTRVRGEEVSYQEMLTLHDADYTYWLKTRSKKAVMSRSGYQKILACRHQAALDGYAYVWIDTCCIDKSSSAELSKAINSMFKWYEQAQVCYAYLSDLPAGSEGSVEERLPNFRSSKWFTRGWCLQELIAPPLVVFYASDWSLYGSRANEYNRDRRGAALLHEVIEITGIDEYALDGGEWLGVYSVAQKMSWASKRETTRIEDMAYCLLGLFGVNMPLLYGEGRQAFIRLQEEIIKNTLSNVLASAPYDYRNSGSYVQTQPDGKRPPYLLTNKGLQISLQLARVDELDVVVGLLDCASVDDPAARVGICLDERFSNEDDLFNLDPDVRRTWTISDEIEVHGVTRIGDRQSPVLLTSVETLEVFPRSLFITTQTSRTQMSTFGQNANFWYGQSHQSEKLFYLRDIPREAGLEYTVTAVWPERHAGFGIAQPSGVFMGELVEPDVRIALLLSSKLEERPQILVFAQRSPDGAPMCIVHFAATFPWPHGCKQFESLPFYKSDFWTSLGSCSKWRRISYDASEVIQATATCMVQSSVRRGAHITVMILSFKPQHKFARVPIGSLK